MLYEYCYIAEIPESIIQRIQPYITSEEFTPENVSKVSKACTSICRWVRAMEKYYWVAKSVAPKRARLLEAQLSLEKTLEDLEHSKEKLRQADNNIRILEEKYEESLERKQELAAKVDECVKKLGRAEKLLGGLGDERTRWNQTLDELRIARVNLVGESLLAAGFMCYLGAFNGEYRRDLRAQWVTSLVKSNVPIDTSSHSSFVSIMGDPVSIREWNISGLPRDNQSVETAVIIHSNNCRWPLFIDPQEQANRWIRNMVANLDVVKPTDKDFARTLENAVRFGKTVLIENVDETLDPTLDPILLKQIYTHQNQSMIKLGDTTLPYHNDFRLFMTTRLANPQYSPEICSKVCLIDFTLSEEGLADQLLALLVAKERPDLEEAKNQLVISNAQMKKELKEVEDRILYLLSTASGNPLDDEVLIDTLHASKSTSLEIKKRVVKAEETESMIDKTRMQYRTVSDRATVLYFAVVSMASVDSMYQYSLQWFTKLFLNCVAQTQANDDITIRLKSLVDEFTYSLYCNVCRSLFERHKLLFSFLMCSRILSKRVMSSAEIDGDDDDDDEAPRMGIDQQEWRFVISGTTPYPPSTLPNPTKFLISKAWDEIKSLSTLPMFEGLDEYITEYPDAFLSLFNATTVDDESFPVEWRDLDEYQRMCIIRAIRPDLVTTCMQEIVAKNLNQNFVVSPTFGLSSIYKDTGPTTPMLFILFPGANPIDDVMALANEMHMTKKLHIISLGQGQGPRAVNLINEGMAKGYWVFLQNCHLASSWLPTLERTFESMDESAIQRDFRLILSSKPTPAFPVTILQNSIKITNEPPRGIRANLMRTYSMWDESFYNDTKNPAIWKTLLYCLSYFHAIIQVMLMCISSSFDRRDASMDH